MALTAKWSDFSRIDPERALAACGRVLPGWLALVLVLAIGWQLARIVWLLVPGSPLGDPVEAPAGAAAASRPASDLPDVRAIADAHIFGITAPDEAAPPPVEDAHEDLADTQLNLMLRGTIAVGEPERSIAIISGAGNEEKIYMIRDAVAQGTTLHAVYADRVILNRNGALEALRLPQEFARSAPPARRVATPAPAPASGGGNASIQQVLTENVTELADVIRPTPYFVAGQQQGYRVYPGRDRRKFAALGLRPGDLIKDIDGASLTDPQQAMEIFQNLGSADQVSVTVERNGQPEVIVLSTSQLADATESDER